MATMFGWCRLPADCASWRKRLRMLFASAGSSSLLRTTLTATGRPITGSSALCTTAMPPRPSSPVTTYLPMRAIGSHRQEYGEAGVAGLRLDLELAAVLLDDLVADGEPEPGALAHVLGGEERIEDARQHVGGNAMAVVGDVDRHAAIVAQRGTDADLAARLGRRLRRVHQQVGDHLVDLRRRAGDARDVAEGLLHLAPPDLVRGDAQGALDAFVQVDLRGLAAVEAAEILEVGHQLGDAGDAVQAVLQLRVERLEAPLAREGAHRLELRRERRLVGLLRGKELEELVGLVANAAGVAEARAHGLQA